MVDRSAMPPEYAHDQIRFRGRPADIGVDVIVPRQLVLVVAGGEGGRRVLVGVIAGEQTEPEPQLFHLGRALQPLGPALAVANAGRSKPARMAMIAITTNNSIKVNALATRNRRFPLPSPTTGDPTDDSLLGLCPVYRAVIRPPDHLRPGLPDRLGRLARWGGTTKRIAGESPENRRSDPRRLRAVAESHGTAVPTYSERHDEAARRAEAAHGVCQILRVFRNATLCCVSSQVCSTK
jgi:hypothetical protein